MNNRIGISAVLVATGLLNGCAFHKSTDEVLREAGIDPTTMGVTTAAQPRSYEAAIDWAPEPTPRLGETLKARRQMLLTGADHLTMAQPVTLPQVTPGSIYIATQYPPGELSNGVDFARATVRIQDTTHQIIVDANLSENKENLVLILGGLNSLLGNNHAIQGNIEIELFAAGKKIFKVSLLLRTPPADIQTNKINTAEWVVGSHSPQQGIVSTEIRNTPFTLLRALTVTNNEESPIEFKVPRRNGARLEQTETVLSHHDTGCGFAIHRNSRQVQLSEDVVFLPLDSRFVVEASLSIESPSATDDIFYKLRPGQTATIGVFGVGPSALSWYNHGPRGTRTWAINVMGDCYNECVERQCSGPGDPGESDVTVLSGITIKACRCLYVQRRHSAQAIIGEERGIATLHVDPSITQIAVRYSDLDFSLDSETRMFPFIDNGSAVPWVR